MSTSWGRTSAAAVRSPWGAGQAAQRDAAAAAHALATACGFRPAEFRRLKLQLTSLHSSTRPPCRQNLEQVWRGWVRLGGAATVGGRQTQAASAIERRPFAEALKTKRGQQQQLKCQMGKPQSSA